MKIYRVGGFVRDKLLGVEAKDCDYVVVGATAEEMISLKFEKVGADFPVFLHPETRDEYALARTERKAGKGYNGFETYFGKEVTLEEDLRRRDFTANAMALDENDNLIDPFSGAEDIRNKILRHVNDEAFADDPVRILRMARFISRFGPDWTIAPETLELARKAVVNDA